MEFDFDAWANLAKEHREEFERRREEAIEELICAAPASIRPRLRQLQFRIDLERRRCANPLGACLRISSMMWDSFQELHAVLNGLESCESAAGAKRSAEVLPFKPPRLK